MTTTITTESIPGLGARLIARLNAWGFTTLEDLARVGVWEGVHLPESDPKYTPRNCYYLPAVADIGGIGPVKINMIRRALAAHGLELTDEYQASQSAWLK